ncbi:MAG: AraC family transcriptional regulator [Clostridiales bacterium]|nr:AraC family transcriptional regulator [Clostridiales bacterium]
MKTLEEYIREQQREGVSEPVEREREKRRKVLAKECEEKGFFEVVRNPQSAFDQIAVSYHGPPDDFNRIGYMHKHNYFEMMYVYRGNCVNKMPGDVIHLHEGDIVLLNPNVLHCPHVDHNDDVLLNFWISNDLIQQNIIPLLRNNPLFMDFFIDFLYRAPESKRFLYFSHNSPRIRQICNDICLESFQRQDFFASVQESALTMLFALLARDCKSSWQLPEASSKDSLIYELLTYIEQNLATVTLDSLSRRFQYTSVYLSRLLKKHTGKSFSKIVQSQKMERVAQYLKTTGLPVIDIANLVGFSDIAYFNKCFKANFGQTPTEYRRSIQQG